MTSLHDKIYIQQVLGGNSEAFAPLVDAYKNMVFSICFRILKHREDAEDAAQSTFIKAYNNLHTFNGKSKFSTWLYTIAYRTAITETKLNSQESVSEDYLLKSADEDSIAPVRTMELKDQQVYIKQAIEMLPELDGLIITLFYMDDCSIQEIVDITALSDSNIKVKLHRARKQLKVNLQNLLPSETSGIR